MSQKSTDLDGTLGLKLMFSTVYCHQPLQTYVISNLYTKCVEDTLPNPMLNINDSMPLGPIKRHAIGPCLKSVHDSTPLSPILPVYKVHTHFFFFLRVVFKIILPPTLVFTNGLLS